MYGIAVYKLFMGGYVRRDIPTQTLSDTCARPSASRRGAHNETRLRRGFAGLRLCESSANDRGEGQASSARRDGVSNPRVVLLGRGVTPPLHHRGGMPARPARSRRPPRRRAPPRRAPSSGTPRRVRARQAARASDRVFDRLRVRAEEQIGARVHERRTERRGPPGGDAGAANHPRATDPDPPNDHTVTPQEEVDGMITQLPGPRVQSQTRPRGCPLEG